MSETTPVTLAQRIGSRLGERIASVSGRFGETTVEGLPENWLAVATTLRDDAEFHFELLIDVSGIDYLSYGQVEWDTTDVSSTGFSRGVEGAGPGRFDWSHRPSIGTGHKRFAAVAHLLSIRN